MRYCERCGYVMDEFDAERDEENCPVCGDMLSEDDMTALKYAELSEAEKDAYDEQLIKLIENSPKFEERTRRMCGLTPESGGFWAGFRVDKYARFKPEERNLKAVLESRKANEPFKPFPPIDIARARKYAEEEEISRRLVAEGYYSKSSAQESNIPKCPVCSSTDLSKISSVKKAAKIGLFGIFGTGDSGKTWKCNHCGSKF